MGRPFDRRALLYSCIKFESNGTYTIALKKKKKRFKRKSVFLKINKQFDL